MNQNATSGFNDPTGLTRWTKWFLYAYIAIAVIALFSGQLEYQLLSDFEKGIYTSESQIMAAAESNDARQRVVGIIQFAVFVVTAILILMWIHRANFNARQLGATGMEFTPGWSIGWYFIPIAYLWKPYQAMKEILRASKNPVNWQDQSVSSVLPWWWFFWIISNILDMRSFGLSMQAEELNELVAANVVTQISDVVYIPLNLIVLTIIARVYEMQMSHHSKKSNWPMQPTRYMRG